MQWHTNKQKQNKILKYIKIKLKLDLNKSSFKYQRKLASGLAIVKKAFSEHRRPLQGRQHHAAGSKVVLVTAMHLMKDDAVKRERVQGRTGGGGWWVMGVGGARESASDQSVTTTKVIVFFRCRAATAPAVSFTLLPHITAISSQTAALLLHPPTPPSANAFNLMLARGRNWCNIAG